MRLCDRRGPGRRRGAAMVETSIVLSVFFLLVLGMIEMSQMGMASQLVTSAANAGCRVAVVNGHSQADVASAVSTLLASGGINVSSGINASTYTITTSPSDVTTSHLGDSITVTVSVPFSSISWLGAPMFLGASTITSSATLSSERP